MCLAAATAGYPAVIKIAFNSLLNPGSIALPWLLAAIVGVTAARGLFLYLHQVTASRIVTRMVTDIQKAAFAHLMNADFARLTRETTGRLVSRLTNDLAAIHAAAQTTLVAFVRDVADRHRPRRLHDLPRLGDDAGAARRRPARGPAPAPPGHAAADRWRAAPRPRWAA